MQLNSRMNRLLASPLASFAHKFLRNQLRSSSAVQTLDCATMVTTEVVEKTAARPAWPISVDNINPNLVVAEYAVRGEIVKLAGEIKTKLEKGEKYPFDKVVMCNIGNPQALGQKPITFFRQVLALADYPQIMDNEAVSQLFPVDAIKRAKEFLDAIGSTGAYTDSQGAPIFRQQIAEGMKKRDGGHEVDTKCLFMTDGASPSVHRVIEMLTRNCDDAFLTPIPQYPLYSAALALHGAHLAPYYLDEDNSWGLTIPHLRDQIKAAEKEGKNVRALVVINPGNPTGGVLSKANQIDIVRFAEENNLVLMADEVYATNVYAEFVKAADLVTKAVAKNEEGNLVYGLSKPIDDDVTFWAYAIWEDEAALKYHLQSSYAKKFLEYNLEHDIYIKTTPLIAIEQIDE